MDGGTRSGRGGRGVYARRRLIAVLVVLLLLALLIPLTCQALLGSNEDARQGGEQRSDEADTAAGAGTEDDEGDAGTGNAGEGDDGEPDEADTAAGAGTEDDEGDAGTGNAGEGDDGEPDEADTAAGAGTEDDEGDAGTSNAGEGDDGEPDEADTAAGAGTEDDEGDAGEGDDGEPGTQDDSSGRGAPFLDDRSSGENGDEAAPELLALETPLAAVNEEDSAAGEDQGSSGSALDSSVAGGEPQAEEQPISENQFALAAPPEQQPTHTRERAPTRRSGPADAAPVAEPARPQPRPSSPHP